MHRRSESTPQRQKEHLEKEQKSRSLKEETTSGNQKIEKPESKNQQKGLSYHQEKLDADSINLMGQITNDYRKNEKVDT